MVGWESDIRIVVATSPISLMVRPVVLMRRSVARSRRSNRTVHCEARSSPRFSEMIQVPIERGELAAEVFGPVDANPVLLIAGGGGAMWSWSRILPEAWPDNLGSVARLEPVRSLAADMRVAVYDQAGIGLSATTEPADNTATAALDALAVGRALLGERFTVTGMSLGGAAAIRLALDQPTVVEQLVLVCTFASASTFVSVPVATNGEIDDERSVGADVRRSLQPGFCDRHPDLVDAVIAASLDLDVHPALNDRSIEVFLSHDGHDLVHIAAPTTVVCGSADSVFGIENSEQIANSIPDSRFVRLLDVGHAVHLEAPHALSDAIRGAPH